MTDNPALEALLAYEQADEDGVMVLVSRQAIHEIAGQLSEALAEVEAKNKDIQTMSELSVAARDERNEFERRMLEAMENLRVRIVEHEADRARATTAEAALTACEAERDVLAVRFTLCRQLIVKSGLLDVYEETIEFPARARQITALTQASVRLFQADHEENTPDERMAAQSAWDEAVRALVTASMKALAAQEEDAAGEAAGGTG